MLTESEICGVIDKMQCIRCTYNGYDRVEVLPLVLLRNDKDQLILEGWQTAGESSSRKPPFWLKMDIDEILNFQLTGRVFAPPEIPDDYNPDRRYHDILCRVPKP
jgi:hypothetical protein